MERSFIATKESEYYIDLNKYLEKRNKQVEFVNQYFSEKGIDGSKYIVGGNGFVNKPFKEYEKSDIGLSIEPTENNLNKFSKMLCRKDTSGLCAFKKSSKIAKEFAQRCVDNEIVINLHSPRISDYFKSLEHGFRGCNFSRFEYEDNLYIKVSSEYLKEDDTPKGFVEVKLSEFYKKIEECHEKEKR